MVDEEKPKDRTLVDILKDLKKIYGEELLTILLGTNAATLRKWISGKVVPSETQRKQLVSVLEVHDLLEYLAPFEEKIWWVTFDDFYLYGTPAEEIRVRPGDVRISALIKRGNNENM